MRGISKADWAAALKFCDSSHLTLPLYLRCGDRLPSPVRHRLEKNLDDNTQRWAELKRTYRDVSDAFKKHDLKFVVLKGFSHWPLFVADPRHRAQYDIDLLLRPEDVGEAAKIATALGFEPAHKGARSPTDHFPTLIRKTGWAWRGDYYDPKIPFSLELHFRCWNRDEEHFGPEFIDHLFWSRLRSAVCEDLSFDTLHPADSVLFAALHIIRHLIHGNLRASHAYEMGWFLDRSAKDNAFWQEWKEMHDTSLQEQQAICFGLAHRWFGCSLHPIAKQSIASLPDEIARWLERYAYSPLAAPFRPNKHELWLHWNLVTTRHQRLRVLNRKLFPRCLPGPVAALHIKPERLTWQIRLQSQLQYCVFIIERTKHHLATLLPTLIAAGQWFGAEWAKRYLHLRRSAQLKFTTLLQPRHKWRFMPP